MNRFFLLLGLSAIFLLGSASSINQPKKLAVTIYNDRFAIIKDTRSITFDQGRSDLYFTDVSSRIQTETVTFKAVKNPESIKVFEQNYEANLVNTRSILKKYINKEIEVFATLGQKSVRVKGKLLAYTSGYILQTNYGIEVLNRVDGIVFDKLPKGFFTLPTLNWKVYSETATTTDCEVAYRTYGFKWKSDYTVIINHDETKADFGGWVTIDNKSGKKYQNTKLKLIAGDVNLVSTSSARPAPMMMMSKSSAMASPAPPTFSQKSFSDFHLYTLSEPVTLNDNSQKQVEFIPKVYDMSVRKYNLISISAGGYTQTGLKAGNRIEFMNSKSNKLGMPMPKGTVRVFKTDDADGSLEFIGEDWIDHTPKNENITLTTGNAFDITAKKIATNYKSFGKSHPRFNDYMADLNLTISNHKDIPAEIVVEINNYRGNNVEFDWKTTGLNIEKVSAYLFRIKRVFQANEKMSYIWSEDYRA